MNHAIWLFLAALILAPAATPSATKDPNGADKEMLKMLDFLRDMEMIKRLDMLQDLQNVEAIPDQAKADAAAKSAPVRKKEPNK